MERDHVEAYRSLFVHQEKRFAVQTASGSYYLRRRPVTNALVERHLAGEVTAGWYALADDSTVKWACVDADQPDGLSDLRRLWQEFRHHDVPAYIEESRRGGHLWVFSEPIPARPLRRLVVAVVESAKIEPVEVFPKQDQLRTGRVGSLVRGPLGIHRKDEKSYGFVDPVAMKAIGLAQVDQLDYLMSVERVSAAQVADTLAKLWDEMRRNARGNSEGRRSIGIISQLKEKIDMATLVTQYVELDRHGRGHCPWHGPDRHPSLVVNPDDGYFVDFHDGTGGDVIEFYRRIEGLSPREAIRRLAARFL